jgi:hypothetical protein
VVVDFAVEDDPDASVFITDGLVTGVNVDDAEAAHCQSDILLGKQAIVVWPTMDDLFIHRHQHVAIHLLSPV